MRKIIALLLMLALVTSLAMLSNPALAQEGDGEGETSEGDGGGTEGTSPPDESHQHVGSPQDVEEHSQEEQGSPPPEGTLTIPDEVKAGAAAGTIGALVAVFVIWLKRGGTAP